MSGNRIFLRIGILGLCWHCFSSPAPAQEVRNQDLLAIEQSPLLLYIVRAKLNTSSAGPRLVVLVDSLSTSKSVKVDSSGTVSFPPGRKPFALELESVRFYKLDGTELSRPAAGEFLSTMRPVFFFDNFAGDVVPLPTNYRRLLNDSCLIVITPSKVRPKE